jgi:hypothetical protein
MKLGSLVLLLFAPLAYSAEPRVQPAAPPVFTPCIVESKSTPLGADYVRFTGSSGLKTDLLFSQHIDPGMAAELETHVNSQFKGALQLKLIKEVANKIKASHREVVVAKRQELKLLDELTESQKIRWLGVELPDAEVAESRKHLVMERISLEKALSDAGVGRRDIDDLVLLLQDSVQYWLTSAPDRIKTYRWIGIESTKEHSLALKNAEEIGRLKTALTEYDKQIQSLNPENLKSLEDEIGRILGEKRSVARDSEKRIVQRFPSSESQGMAAAQIKAARDLVLASHRRDQLIAERINQDIAGDGILTIGRAHKETLSEFLVQACQRRLKPGPPSAL